MVPLRHSTLGGNNSDRAARRSSTEFRSYPCRRVSSLEEIPTSLAWREALGRPDKAQAGRPQADLRHCGLRTGPRLVKGRCGTPLGSASSLFLRLPLKPIWSFEPKFT